MTPILLFTSYNNFSRKTKRNKPDLLILGGAFSILSNLDYVDRIYLIELELKDTARSASYIDIHLQIDSEDRLRTDIYHKIYVLNFPFVNKIYL
jgi:hypothetical protein